MSIATLSNYLSYLPLILLGLGIIIGIIHYKTLPNYMRFILYFFIIAIIFDISSRILGAVYGNNLILISTFAIVEILIFGYIYIKYMFDEKLQKVTTLICLIGLGAAIYDCLSSNYEPIKFQTYARTLSDFLFVALSMMYFFVKLSKGTNPGSKKMELNTYVLIYFALHFIFFIPINYIVNASTNFIYAFLIGNMVLTTAFYSSLTYYIWKNGKIQKH